MTYTIHVIPVVPTPLIQPATAFTQAEDKKKPMKNLFNKKESLDFFAIIPPQEIYTIW